MKEIKKFYNEHRIFTILMALVIVCFILIITVLIQCFYVGKGKDKYGARLEGIEQREISSETRKDIEDKLVQEGIISQANITIQGKIIYIKLVCTPEADLVEAQGIAQKSLGSLLGERGTIESGKRVGAQRIHSGWRVGADGFGVLGVEVDVLSE